jgi:hypothetical protein
MYKILTLASLGLTLAFSGAALAAPVEGSEQNESNYWYKRFYGHKIDQARGDRSMLRLREGRVVVPKTGSVGSAGSKQQ